MSQLTHSLLATLVLSTPALAHDSKHHAGPKVEGEVVSRTGSRLGVGTKEGVIAVTLSPETTVERRDGGEPVDGAALEPGQHVVVVGHKLAGGELAASSVLIVGGHAGGDGGPEHAGQQ